MEEIEVHNVWTIYGLNEDGTEAAQPFAEMSRPQDWGDPTWSYHRFNFEWITAETHYINHFHGWTDLKRAPHEYPALFAQLIVQIMMPGSDERKCGRDFLAEDDFWDKKWGTLPPYADDSEDDEEERGISIQEFAREEEKAYMAKIREEEDTSTGHIRIESAESFLELGPCCICGTREGVENALFLDRKAPRPGPGCWGCIQCGLPLEGAVAVLCNHCIQLYQGGAPLAHACVGSPANGERVPYESLTEPFDHDYSKHPKEAVLENERSA